MAYHPYHFVGEVLLHPVDHYCFLSLYYSVDGWKNSANRFRIITRKLYEILITECNITMMCIHHLPFRLLQFLLFVTYVLTRK